MRTRVRRGLERLRRELDAHHRGARQDWLAALVPLAGGAGAGGTLPFGSVKTMQSLSAALSMKPLSLMLSTLVLLVLAVLAVRSKEDESRDDADAPTELIATGGEGDPSLATQTTTLEPAAPPGGRAANPGSDEHASPLRVRGRVTVGHRDPLPGTRVRVSSLEGSWEEGSLEHGAPGQELRSATVLTDAGGEFLWEVPVATTPLTLVARLASGGFFENEVRVELPAGATTAALALHAFPEDGRLKGRVIDEGGVAVAGAEASTIRDAGTTDAEGRFTLVISSLDEKLTGRIELSGFALTSFLVVPDGPEVDAGTLVLKRDAGLAGEVVDEDGHPVEGATISQGVSETGAGFGVSSTSTDALGRFLLRSPDREQPWVRVSKPGFASRIHPFPLPRPLVLERGGHVSGRVRHANGRIALDVRVTLGHPRSVPRRETRTDEEGRFAFECVGADERTLWAAAPGLCSAILDFDLPAGGGRLEDLELVLGDGQELHGLVLDAASRPVPWASVFVESPARDLHEPPRIWVPGIATTDEAGRCVIRGVPAATVLVRVWCAGYANTERTVEVPCDEELVFHLQSSGSVAGLVLDSPTGEAIEDFRLSLLGPAGGELDEPEAERGWRSSELAFRGTHGVWRASDWRLPVGSWVTVEVRATGYAPARQRCLVANDPDPARTVVLLDSGRRLEGRLADREGNPLAGERLLLVGLQHGARASWTATSDAEGVFLFEHVPSGVHELLWTRPLGLASYQPVAWVVEVPEGRDPEPLRLPEWSPTRLRGTLSAPTPLPARVQVWIRPLEEERLATLSDGRRSPCVRYMAVAEQGVFEIEGLEPGRYEIEARAAPHSPSTPWSGRASATVEANVSVEVVVETAR